jgi:hypothetical protein
MVPVEVVVVTQPLAVSAEMVLPIAAPVMVEIPQQELLQLMVVAAVVAQVDREMQQALQVVMALCLLPLIFSRALLTTAMVRQVEHQLLPSILKQF